jgi:hypothetical protein
MNKLELTQRLARECGIEKAGPLTTTGQIGEAKRLVDWIDSSWSFIQSSREYWDWMRRSASFTTVNGQALYTPTQCGILANTFGSWAENTFRCYETSAGVASEMEMYAIDYEEWRYAYDLGSLKLQRTRPFEMAVTPNQSIALGPYPSSGYTITGDYYTAPVTLIVDTDIPEMPAQFHMAIVWKAAMYYGAFEAASEVYENGKIEFTRMMRRIESYSLPGVTMGGALA